MPLKAVQDPQTKQWTWVDSATGQPATQPGGPGTAYTAPSDTTASQTVPNQNVDIAPAGSAAAPAAAASTTTTATGPAAGPASPGTPSSGGYSVSQIIAPSQKEVDDANGAVNTLWTGLQDQQAKVDKARQDVANNVGIPGAAQATLNSEITALNAQYSAYSQALARVQSANANQNKLLTDALHNGQVDPSQVTLANSTAAKADSDANLADSQAKVLVEGSDTQKSYVAAQAASASADAQLKSVQAQIAPDKSAAENNQLNAQAGALTQQRDQANALLPGLLQKQKDDSSLTQAQSKLTDSNSDLAQATIGKTNADAALSTAQAGLAQGQLAAGLPQAQVGLAQGQTAQAQAAAAASQADIAKGQLGPLYGVSQQVAAAVPIIQQMVFGPGGSRDPNEATDLLNQFHQSVSAQLAGTTPYAANVAAANAGLTSFGTQASLANAAQQAMATRASSLTGAGANVFSQLGQMNANAPKGSTAMVGAFSDVLNALGQNAQKYAPPPQTPIAPPLPALLQKLAPAGAPGGVGGLAPTAGGVPGLTGMPTGTGAATTAPATAPATAAAAQTGQTSAPTTSAPVTINIGGSSPNQAPGSNYGAGTAYTGGVAPWNAQPQPSMPAVLQQHQPATTDFVHQLWGNELGSGAVQSPYAGVGASSSGGAAPITPSAPTPLPVMGQAA